MISRRLPTALILALALVACQATGPATGARSSAGPSPRKGASAAPSKGPGATPGPDASSKVQRPGTTYVLPSRLVPPAGGGTKVRGRVALDASYMLATGAGTSLTVAGKPIVGADGATIVSENSAGVVSENSAGIVSENSAGIISENSAGVVSENSAGIISENSVGIVSENAAGIISENSAGIISENSAGFIANGGNRIVAFGSGNLVAAAGDRLIGADGTTLIAARAGGALVGGAASGGARAAGYGLAQAPAAGGEGAPVAGALVGAFDLATGQAVPIGQDEGGKDVFLAYTNAKGEYEVYLPAGLAGNVLLVTSVPNKPDGRLTARAFSERSEARVVALDDLHSSTVDYLRAILAARLEQLFAVEGKAFFPPTLPELAVVGYYPTANEIHAAAKASGYAALGPTARARVAQRVADRVIARSDVFGAEVLPILLPEPTTIQGPALEQLLGQLELVLAGVDRVLAGPGAVAFEDFGFFGFANQLRPADAPWAIKRRGDLLDLLNASFQALPHEDYLDLSASSCIDLGLDGVVKDNIRVGIYSLYFSTVTALFAPDGSGKETAKAALAAAIAEENRLALPEPPAPGAPPVAPAAPAVAVTTAAGTGTKGSQDGPRATATLDTPVGVAAAPDGTLFVAQTGTPAIRRVAPDGTVSTVALSNAGVLENPLGIVRAADGSLYVSDEDQHAIYRISDLDKATALIALVAGTPGTAGAKDAAIGATATFSSPEGLAIGPDGALYVADRANHSIRRVDLGALHPVTTWAGTGKAGHRDDYGRAARLNTPIALAFTAGDAPSAIVAEHAGGLLRRARLKGRDGATGPEAGGITTMAGLAARPGTSDLAEPRAMLARGKRSHGLAVGKDGAIFVADAEAHVVRWFDPTRRWTRVLAGAPMAGGFADGDGPAARFQAPAGLAVDPTTGDVLVADPLNHRVRRIARR